MLGRQIILLSLLAVVTSGPVRPKNDRYHPHSSAARTSQAKGPWDSTDWNQLAKDDIMDSVQVQANLMTKKAKNVILFIGDGMGVSTIAAARLYNAESRGLTHKDIYLSWENFPHVGLSRTYNVDRSTPDSAGTATAYLCGVKANYETVGVTYKVPYNSCIDIAGNEAMSVAKHSIDLGKWTGIVTTARVTHASPAGVYAHVANRDWEAEVPSDVPEYTKCDDIAKQLITDEDNKQTRVILGGGAMMFRGRNESGERTDERNLIEEWIEMREEAGQSHMFVENKAEFDTVNPDEIDYLLGLFNDDHMDYEADRIKKNPLEEPSLTEMTEKAIRLLSRSPNGYFLFVEGGRIDHSHHDGIAFKALNDTLALSDAVQKAAELTDPSDTLIVVSADHSHVFTFGGYATFEPSIFDVSDGTDTLDRKPFLQLNYANGPGYPFHRMENGDEVPRKDLTGVNTRGETFHQDTGIPMYSETHGGEDVAIYARGPMSHLFHGQHEQNYIAHVMKYASCVGEYQTEAHCSGTSVGPAHAQNTRFLLLVVAAGFICRLLGQ